jgi:hypothetical protein
MEGNKRLYPISEDVFNRKVYLSSKQLISGKGVRPKYPGDKHEVSCSDNP